MTFEERLDAVRMMHETMLSMNNEGAYMAWIWVMPDAPSEDDFEYFAESEDAFADLEGTFNRLYHGYIEDGLFEPSDEVLAFLKGRGYQLEDVDIFNRRGEI